MTAHRAKGAAARYAAIAETTHALTLGDLIVDWQRVRADLDDPAFKASDAATSGMLAEEERLLAAVAMATPGSVRDVRRKAELYPATFCEEGVPTKASALLLAAVISDLRLLETRG
jgi:hypothetical protein